MTKCVLYLLLTTAVFAACIEQGDIVLDVRRSSCATDDIVSDVRGRDARRSGCATDDCADVCYVGVNACGEECFGKWDISRVKTCDGQPLRQALRALEHKKVGVPFRTKILDDAMQKIVQYVDDNDDGKIMCCEASTPLTRGVHFFCRDGGWVWFINDFPYYNKRPFVSGAVRLSLATVKSERQGGFMFGMMIEGFPLKSDGGVERPDWWHDVAGAS